MSEHSPGPVLILTALSVEYQAIRAHLTDLVPQPHPEGTMFEVGRSADGHGIAIAEIGEGNARAAVLSERAIASFGPRALIFVGVAGALKDRVNLGDVVVATKVYGYQGGSYQGDAYHARPDAWEASHELEQLARYVDKVDDWTDRRHPDPSRGIPKVHFEPIASGGLLVNSRQGPAAEHLRRYFNDAAAIDMEAVGVSQAGHLNSSCPVLTIRGISDRADGSKDLTDQGGWQPVAAANAAAFALALVGRLAVASARTKTTSDTASEQLLQEVAGSGDSTLVAAQGGSIQVGDSPVRQTHDQQVPGAQASGAAAKPRLRQRATARDSAVVFVAQAGDIYYHPNDSADHG